MVHELFQMPLKVSLKSTMLILDKQVSIIIQNHFKCKKQDIIKVNSDNSDIVTFDVPLLCMMLGGKEKRNYFLFCAFTHWRKKKNACVGPQEEKLINRLEVIFHQQELDSSS